MTYFGCGQTAGATADHDQIVVVLSGLQQFAEAAGFLGGVGVVAAADMVAIHEHLWNGGLADFGFEHRVQLIAVLDLV